MYVVGLDDRQPSFGEGVWVAPTAVVAGAATLGRDVSVWYGAVLRADDDRIVVGDESNLQDGCVLHADRGLPVTVGRSVSVGHRAVLHGCTISDGVLVGMSTTILNGASIGAGCIIAAGAVVKEGAQIPPGSLAAGVPAKVRRSTTDDERATILANARTYLALRSEHAACRAMPIGD